MKKAVIIFIIVCLSVSFAQEGGICSWDPTETYEKGAKVLYNGIRYFSNFDDNINIKPGSIGNANSFMYLNYYPATWSYIYSGSSKIGFAYTVVDVDTGRTVYTLWFGSLAKRNITALGITAIHSDITNTYDGALAK